MKISSFDLNLFVILNAIYTEGSLTKAAEVVGITQPAVSNALSRLRERFDDDLFIRTGSGMVPTQKTENIISDIQNALSLMQQSVNEPDTFDPKLSNRNFKLSLGDVSEGRVLPYIMNEIDKNAPFVSMGSYAYSRSDQVHALATHNLDFVVRKLLHLAAPTARGLKFCCPEAIKGGRKYPRHARHHLQISFDLPSNRLQRFQHVFHGPAF